MSNELKQLEQINPFETFPHLDNAVNVPLPYKNWDMWIEDNCELIDRIEVEYYDAGYDESWEVVVGRVYEQLEWKKKRDKSGEEILYSETVRKFVVSASGFVYLNVGCAEFQRNRYDQLHPETVFAKVGY